MNLVIFAGQTATWFNQNSFWEGALASTLSLIKRGLILVMSWKCHIPFCAAQKRMGGTYKRCKIPPAHNQDHIKSNVSCYEDTVPDNMVSVVPKVVPSHWNPYISLRHWPYSFLSQHEVIPQTYWIKFCRNIQYRPVIHRSKCPKWQTSVFFFSSRLSFPLSYLKSK